VSHSENGNGGGQSTGTSLDIGQSSSLLSNWRRSSVVIDRQRDAKQAFALVVRRLFSDPYYEERSCPCARNAGVGRSGWSRQSADCEHPVMLTMRCRRLPWFALPISIFFPRLTGTTPKRVETSSGRNVKIRLSSKDRTVAIGSLVAKWHGSHVHLHRCVFTPRFFEYSRPGILFKPYWLNWQCRVSSGPERRPTKTVTGWGY
jgi:hypothetical protein